jgi:hypothetical protein
VHPDSAAAGTRTEGWMGPEFPPYELPFSALATTTPIAVSDALLAASGFMLLALLMALTELRRRRHRPQRPALTDGRLHPLP